MSGPRSLVELLSAYLPIDRRAAMVAGRELPARSLGAVLCADISGFTPLTETLEKELGPHRGGEELTQHLNTVYGALIDEVHRYRGSIIGFSGDAITCWFDREGGREARAGFCGLRLQEVMRQQVIVTPSGAQHPLAIRVAVTAGPVRRFVVGDPQVQLLDVLTGKLLERASRGDALAASGEVIVDEEIAAALGPGVPILGTRTDASSQERFAVVGALRGEMAPRKVLHDRRAPSEPWPAIDVRSLTEEQLRPWLHRSVYERLRSGQGDFLAELRQPVALFLRFGQLDFDADETSPQRLDAYVRWAQGILEYYGGALIQLTTGGKGSYLYAAFGAPVAQEDVIERALSSALVLRSPPGELAFIERAQIGISCGRMRAGAYGSERRRTYGVLGDETNVAARLMMKAAPGQVLVSDRITTASVTGYVFESLGAVDLKGKRTSTAVFELCGRSSGRTRAAPRREKGHDVRSSGQPGRPGVEGSMVGRAEERAFLAGAVDSLERGEDVTIVMEGEAGIGKSRLVRDMLDGLRTRAPAIKCITTGADPIEHATSYYAWRQVFSELLGVDRQTDPRDLDEELGRRLPAALLPLAPLLSPVLEFDLPETVESAQLQGSLRAAKTPAYLATAFWSILGTSPLVLVVEDTHWLDSSSWILLEGIRRSTHRPPLMLVLTTRPVDVPAHHYTQLRQAAATRFLPLEAMSPDDAITLVARRLGVRVLPDAVASLIREKAEGNPFFAEELGYALRDGGLIRIEGDACHVEQSLEGLRFPDSVEGVVTSRIDRLEPAVQLTLKVASVIGRVFTLELLRDVYPLAADRAELPRFLDALSRLDLTPRDDDPQTYVFKHAVTLDVSYNLMLFEQRRSLHAAVAKQFENAYADDLTPYYPLLAHHHFRAIEGLARPDAQQLRNVAGALIRAGKQSLERGATPEAIVHLRKALGLVDKLPPSPTRSALELEIRFALSAALLVVLGATHRDVRREFLRARQLCVELGETQRLFEAVFGLWLTEHASAERDAAMELSDQLSEIAAASKVEAQLLLAEQARGVNAMMAGDHSEAVQRMDRVVAMANAVDDGLEVAREARDPLIVTYATRSGEHELTHELHKARDPLVVTYCYRAISNWFLGYPDRASRDATSAIQRAGDVAHPLTLTQALCFGAQVCRYRRDAAGAEALVRRAHALVVEHGFPSWHGTTSSVLGWLELDRGNAEEALVELRSGMAADRASGLFPPSSIIVLADIIDALTRLGRFDEAMGAVLEAQTILDTRLTAFGAPEIHRRHGELCQQRGDHEGAEACFVRALELARAQKARSLELRSATNLHLLRRRLGRPVTESLSAVYRGFTEGHATRDLEEARALLDAEP